MDRFYPRFMILFSAICLLLICLCGCSPSVWVHYPNRLSRAKLFLTEGRDSLAEKELNKRLKSSQDRFLYSLEMGMVQYLKQDFDQSIQEWLIGEEMLKKFDYRPVVSSSYAIQNSLFGIDAKGLHLYSLLVHACNTLLVTLIAGKMMQLQTKAGNPWWPALVGAIYGLHPALIEPVAFASSRFADFSSVIASRER